MEEIVLPPIDLIDSPKAKVINLFEEFEPPEEPHEEP